MKTILQIITYLFIGSILFSQECEECVCEEPVEVWFKISNDKDDKDYGNIIQLDMSKGYAQSDGHYLYLFVQKLDTDEGIVIMFPFGYWETEPIEYIPKEEEEFDLDEYLKQNKGKGVKIAKQYNKVGE